VDFNIGRLLSRYEDNPLQHKTRQYLLATSLLINLGVLGVFKYFNFFADSLVDLVGLFGLQIDNVTLSIVLPVGISFYTFQTLSYTFDIYRGKLEAVDSLLDFAAFVAFFPQLVAGPIERASNLLPQIQSLRPIQVQQIHAGLYLIVWGLFQKIVIADNSAIIANTIFNDHLQYSGIDILVGIVAFAFQIYGDFSGYSDIARGIAKLLGFELMVNFRLPYFALNPSDFWNRWHISLSTWLRDYLYIGLGGSRKGEATTYRNLMLTMLLGGLWHGAAWNFVLWGVYHGTILAIYRRFERKPMHGDPWSGQYNYLIVGFKMLLMFNLTLVGWLIFRVESLEQLSQMIASAFNFTSLALSTSVYDLFLPLTWHITILILFNLWQYRSRNLLVVVHSHWLIQSLISCFLILWMVVFSVRDSVEFIYFQF
jgi:alginate O-acetyltransferase complex protein AlgI